MPELPNIEGGEYLLEALHEAGTFDTTESGSPVPLKWQEIAAFAQLTGSIDEPFEAKTIMDLSKAYVQGHAIGLQSNGIAPFDAWNPIPAEWLNG